MNPQSLPSTARLRRSLARRRVRELRHEHPVLEWLYGRLIVTETALSELARPRTAHSRACDRVLDGNGYAATLDAASIMLEAQLAALSEAQSDLLDGEKPVVLLVDHDPLLLRALERVLRKRYRVLTTTSAEDALTLLAEHAVDVVIADNDLDQRNGGIWLLAQAKASFPEVLRILVCEQPLTDAAGAGETVEHWVRKGARLEVLFERLARSLERR